LSRDWSLRRDRPDASSDGIQAGFPSTDPDCFFNVGDENLTVANATGLRGTTDRLDRFFDHVVAEHNLDFHFGQKVHHILGAGIKLGVSFLASEPLRLGDGNALQPDLLQRFLHLVELEGLDYGLDFLHFASPPGRARVPDDSRPTVSRVRAKPTAA